MIKDPRPDSGSLDIHRPDDVAAILAIIAEGVRDGLAGLGVSQTLGELDEALARLNSATNHLQKIRIALASGSSKTNRKS